jgi:signal transduction histidine kinase
MRLSVLPNSQLPTPNSHTVVQQLPTPNSHTMSTAASSEFMALCRAQLRLLAEGLGASRSVVYLTEELEKGGESKLLPVVVYPETEVDWSKVMSQITAESFGSAAQPQPKQISPDIDRNVATLIPAKPLRRRKKVEPNHRLQIVLPLVHEGTIMGLLITTRETHPWNVAEQTEIQHIAQTISLAGILDLRRNWLATELRHQQELQLQQQNLLHNLLHQLRNPLTAIRTFGKLLIKRLQAEDPNQTVAGSIVRESDRLQELLQHLEIAIDLNLVNEAESDLDKFKQLPASSTSEVNRSANLLLPDAAFRIESCQITDVLNPLIISAEAIAQDRNLTFHAHIPPNLPLVQAHPAALREVLSNLIDNALKYTPAGGEVDLDVELCNALKGTIAESAESTLQICIRDTGMGIPPQDLEKLFTRHYRGVQAQGSIAGTGLGLAIAKELVTHMHGKMEVFSPPPGADCGTEFILWLQLLASGE